MKRILLVTENLGSGGAERQLCGLAIMLKRRGYHVRVITYFKRQFYEPLLRESGVDYRLIESAFDKRKRLKVLLSELKDFKSDVVISFLPSVNITMCLLRFIYPSRLIVSERNFTLDWSLSTKLRYNLYRIADYVVPNSYAEAENIVKHCPWLRNKIRAIQNFTDTQRFKPSSEAFHRDIFNILSVGRITAQKNILAYFEALAMVRDKGIKFHAVWLGSQYDSNYVEKVHCLIDKYHLSDIITLKEQTKDIAEAYHQADAFCLPSLFEGYPNVLCEAMASGLPVICSNIQEMPRIVTNGVNGYLFNPQDPTDIALAVEKIVSTPSDILQKMKETNRDRVVLENSIDSFADSYVQLIEKQF